MNDSLDNNEEEVHENGPKGKSKSKDGSGDVRFWYYTKLEEINTLNVNDKSATLESKKWNDNLI